MCVGGLEPMQWYFWWNIAHWLHSINFYAGGGIIVQKKDKCAESSTLSTEPRLITTVILTTKTMI